ncbi:hypothetical protein M5K25_013499 [Dendrobium thyrsiflorum]|uniref:Uncharacterized protein n=1 Tax=Dendrobium thyrsiflorum TaxID=117978 RepID=A0ABD0UTS8_DENTH
MYYSSIGTLYYVELFAIDSPMEEQMRLYIRLAMEDSGFHLRTSMDNNMYNLINVTRFPSFDTSARMRKLSIKDFVLFSQKIWCRRENLSFPNPRSIRGTLGKAHIAIKGGKGLRLAHAREKEGSVHRRVGSRERGRAERGCRSVSAGNREQRGATGSAGELGWEAGSASAGNREQGGEATEAAREKKDTDEVTLAGRRKSFLRAMYQDRNRTASGHEPNSQRICMQLCSSLGDAFSKRY